MDTKCHIRDFPQKFGCIQIYYPYDKLYCMKLVADIFILDTSQQTQHICITFMQRRPDVFDVGPTLYKCYTIFLCLMWYVQ